MRLRRQEVEEEEEEGELQVLVKMANQLLVLSTVLSSEVQLL